MSEANENAQWENAQWENAQCPKPTTTEAKQTTDLLGEGEGGGTLYTNNLMWSMYQTTSIQQYLAGPPPYFECPLL